MRKALIYSALTLVLVTFGTAVINWYYFAIRTLEWEEDLVIIFVPVLAIVLLWCLVILPLVARLTPKS
ncbi:MAG: hypothetical protein A2589_01305 [Candidatus Vogelbacteria bacterium RIFOXYD1_FULL_46_19]|uniref:Uncharacterized protein n=1 Tax=Candidatus Vogelbacteria bacterium RIFOXYD1_FULL_46_19 TaxID=1802439 RepID=A0A1G2QHI6_9BACT|nr:MAG: hypothetical protein A2589_01305 [Candidatus Vogelbacteria bacterium RIFOXYD1_FULL_46_19]